MKKVIVMLLLVCSATAQAQSKSTREALANSRTLQNTVFGTKDSATLDKLFASTLAYGHSSGKVETKDVALHNIIHNKSTYTESSEIAGYNVTNSDDSIIVKHNFIAIEKKVDGTESNLKIMIEMVWAKENGKLRLFRRQATKL